MDIIQNSLGAVILIILIKIALDIFIIACISVTARSTKNTCNNIFEMEKRNEERHREQMAINQAILAELRRLNSINNTNNTNNFNSEPNSTEKK